MNSLSRRLVQKGPVRSVSNPYRSTTDSTYGITTYQYDGLSRTTLVIPPDGNSTSDNVSTQYCAGTTLVTDQAGHWRRSTADGLGRLTEVDEPNSTSATVNVCPGTGEPIWVTTYSYDNLSNLTSVAQGGSRNRSFVYDSLKRLTSSTNPEAGTVTYTYDADSNVLTKKDARSITITYSYDTLNRMTGRTYSNGDPSVTYAYDQSTCIGQSPCYNIGRRTSMTDAAGSELWSYDKMGREWGEQRTTNSITKTTGYTYNLDGTLATLTYPSGRVITYTTDPVERSSEAVDVTNSINYAVGYCANGSGMNGTCFAPQGAVAESLNGASLATTYIYNNRLQPCWIYATTGTPLARTTSCTGTATAGTALDLKYNFALGTADNGNVMGITNDIDNTRSQNFIYDQVNRIVTAETTSTFATSPANCWGESYTYDQWANLTAIGVAATSYNGCTQENLSVSALSNNQLSATGLSYDASGNLLGDGMNTYGWNAESEIKSATGVNYTYDGDGGRVQKSNGKIYWYGAGTEILDETDASGNITDEYVYLGGEFVARRDASGNIVYYVADYLGTSRVVTNSTGGILDQSDFYPFGGERVLSSSSGNTYKFEGEERDAETGNDNFGERHYSHQFGRWLSPDWSSTPEPVPYANLTNPQTLNLYAMVRDNPETFADLDGHDDEGGGDSAGATGDSGAGSVENAGTGQDQTPQPALKPPLWQRILDAIFGGTTNPSADPNPSQNPGGGTVASPQTSRPSTPRVSKAGLGAGAIVGEIGCVILEPCGAGEFIAGTALIITGGALLTYNLSLKKGGSNRAQNRQFDEAVRQIEKFIGRTLSPEEIRRLHDEITGRGLNLDQIVEVGKSMFGPH